MNLLKRPPFRRDLRPKTAGDWSLVGDGAEPHLGGNLRHGDENSFCPSVWNYVIDRFCVESVMDLGSGVGHVSHYFRKSGIHVVAVDGMAANIEAALVPTILHDLTSGPVVTRVDLVHCQEVVEHIEETHLDNLLQSLMCGKYVLMTNAVPGQTGYHHVNLQPTEYWAEHLTKRGCFLLEQETARIRHLASTDNACWMAATGSIYVNSNRF